MKWGCEGVASVESEIEPGKPARKGHPLVEWISKKRRAYAEWIRKKRRERAEGAAERGRLAAEKRRYGEILEEEKRRAREEWEAEQRWLAGPDGYVGEDLVGDEVMDAIIAWFYFGELAGF